ncbi:hypothetical protein SmJEL517_g01000 [Synchytrium microbalum]|uniref:Matrin-type domain-containing protein n=1 Tax=Synchytrium microbalum TaxID=1806994 RepID=A0A507CH38_9FUNG|nr:uncharacterized protein SmJEL517_g01000 [Synchytrium microbalum]TPX36965.1 hypothetical protein SmJEL517_g01000 [Synchytrium microbalum]
MSSFQGHYGASTGGDTGFRRTWDKEKYKRGAEQEESAPDESTKKKRKKKTEPEEEVSEEPQMLRARDTKVDLETHLNKTQVVTVSSDANRQPGYYCDVCDCTLKDSVAYLDHINGKRHQGNLGVSMRVERSTVEQVRAKLASLKKKIDQPAPEYDLDKRVEQIKQQEVRDKEARKQEKKERKKKDKEEKAAALAPVKDEEARPMDPEMAALMGFGDFGTSKKKK